MGINKNGHINSGTGAISTEKPFFFFFSSSYILIQTVSDQFTDKYGIDNKCAA